MRKPERVKRVVKVRAFCWGCGWSSPQIGEDLPKDEVHLNAKAHAASKHHRTVVCEDHEITYDAEDPK